jgi:hypothetical protein
VQVDGGRRPGRVGDATAGVEDEGPEGQVDQQPEHIGGEGAVGGEHEHLAPAGGRGKEPGEQPDPGAAEHLVRHPRTHSAGDEGGGEQRRASEGKAESGTENPAGNDQREEDHLDPGSARIQRTEGGPDRRQHTEHGDGLGVDTSVGQLGEYDGQYQNEQGSEQQWGHGGIAEPTGRDDERPEEGDQSDEGGHDEHGAGAETDRDGGGGTHAHGATSARASVTWPMVR